MSATGRGAARAAFDWYPTPAKAVRQLLNATQNFSSDGFSRKPGDNWLEPGAGDGSIIRAVNRDRAGIRWTAVEIQKRFERRLWADCIDVQICDFRRATLGLYDMAIGNPPYNLAATFVHRSLQVSKQVVMLLRLNWLGSSAKRRWLFEACGVPDLFVLSERPSFHPKGVVGKSDRRGGETDACDYAWMRWYADGSQKGTMQILWGDR